MHKRQKLEDLAINQHLARKITALKQDRDLRHRFIKFAANLAGIPPEKIGGRVKQLLKTAGPRTPTAFLALAIERFFSEGHWRETPTIKINGIEVCCPPALIEGLSHFVLSHPGVSRITHATSLAGDQRITLLCRAPDFYPKSNNLQDHCAAVSKFEDYVDAANYPTEIEIPQCGKFAVEYAPDYGSHFAWESDSPIAGLLSVQDIALLQRLCAGNTHELLEVEIKELVLDAITSLNRSGLSEYNVVDAALVVLLKPKAETYSLREKLIPAVNAFFLSLKVKDQQAIEDWYLNDDMMPDDLVIPDDAVTLANAVTEKLNTQLKPLITEDEFNLLTSTT